MPLPAVVVVALEVGAAVGARLAARKLAQEAAKKKVLQEAAKRKIAQEAAEEAAKRKIAQETAKKTAQETGKKVGNTPLNTYMDKAMNKLSKYCQKAVKKLGAHIHGRKGDVIDKDSKVESNHIIQNAMLEGARGKGSDICPAYKATRGPAIPLGKEDHDVVTADQRTNSKAHRNAGTQPTYEEARQKAKKQVEGTGVNKRDAECIMKFTDEVFRQLCPDLVDGNKTMRTPQR